MVGVGEGYGFTSASDCLRGNDFPSRGMPLWVCLYTRPSMRGAYYLFFEAFEGLNQRINLILAYHLICSYSAILASAVHLIFVVSCEVFRY